MEIVAAVITGFLGLVTGTIGTFLVGHKLEQKRRFLAKSREALEKFYSPLEIAVRMNKLEFDRYFDSKTKKEDKEYIETNIWYPNNTKIKETITNEAHVLPEIPDEILKLLQHINVWLCEYDKVYVKSSKTGPAFAGPRGFPYPKEADQFIYTEARRLRTLLNKKSG